MAGPKLDGVLADLESAADKLGIKVSYEALQETVGGGGLCKVKGAFRVIIDKRGTVGEKVSTLARALSSFDLEGIFLAPQARQIVEQHQALSRQGAA